MRSELKRIHLAENSTTIFVTHDQAEAMSLADRIVVMYRGKIEQVGTPMEIYRDSATYFAASFIGTPPTNFFEIRIEKTGEGYAAVNEHIRYRIPAPLSAALAPREGKKTILGIRPEFIELFPRGEKAASRLCDAVIDFIEPQGSHSILIAHIGGAEIKIVTPNAMDIRVNTPISLTVKDEQVMFFDPDTGIRILMPEYGAFLRADIS
jgi:multiple sugar transport system ATP-binding protein